MVALQCTFSSLRRTLTKNQCLSFLPLFAQSTLLGLALRVVASWPFSSARIATRSSCTECDVLSWSLLDDYVLWWSATCVAAFCEPSGGICLSSSPLHWYEWCRAGHLRSVTYVAFVLWLGEMKEASGANLCRGSNTYNARDDCVRERWYCNSHSGLHSFFPSDVMWMYLRSMTYVTLVLIARRGWGNVELECHLVSRSCAQSWART